MSGSGTLLTTGSAIGSPTSGLTGASVTNSVNGRVTTEANGSASTIADAASATQSTVDPTSSAAHSGSGHKNGGQINGGDLFGMDPGSSGSNSGSNSGNSTLPPASELAGGIVGGIAGLAALLLVALIFSRWYRRRHALQEISDASPMTSPTTPVTPAGRGMAERAGLLPLAAMLRGHRSSAVPILAPAPQQGFQRVSGRKLPSAFSPGMTSDQVNNGRAVRPSVVPMPTAFGRSPEQHSDSDGSHEMYHGMGLSRSPFLDSNLQAGPARQATLHPGGPYGLNSPMTPPASPSANLLENRAPTPIYFLPHGRFAEDV